jgi:ribosomal protein S14
MKHSAASDRIARARLAARFTKLRTARFVRSNGFLGSSVRAQAANQLFFLLPFSSRLHNFCTVTSRSRAVIREFKVSRMTLKQLIGLRYVIGLKRSSW